MNREVQDGAYDSGPGIAIGNRHTCDTPRGLPCKACSSEVGESVKPPRCTCKVAAGLASFHQDYCAVMTDTPTAPQQEQAALVHALESIRVLAQDCIDNGHDRGQIGNLMAIRDLCDRAIAAAAAALNASPPKEAK